jgi:hypothetical protein
MTDTIATECTYVEYGCTSGKAPIGDVHDAITGEVIFSMTCCEDCMAHSAYSDWYKAEHGIRPRWMTKAECIEAWWAMPEVAGVRP